MALPAFRALGTFASGTTSCTPGLPTGHTTDDILVLIVECDDAETPNTPSGYTSLGSGNDGADVKLTVFIKRDNGSESAPTVDGTTNHVHAWIAAYSGVENTGSPWLLGSFSNQQTATVTYTGITTGFADALVLLLTAIGDNANDTENLSGYTNANLSSLTDRDDEAETTGTGGGLGFADGGKAAAGATGDSTCTHDNAVGSVSVHLALYSSTAADATLTADSGSYDHTGTAATLKILMPANAGSYSLTGTDASTERGGTLVAVSGSYTLAGNDVAFHEFPFRVSMNVTFLHCLTEQGTKKGDYLLAIYETVASDPIVILNANGFTEHPGSPVIADTGSDFTSTRLTVYERLWDGSADVPSVPLVDGTGMAHIFAHYLAIRARPGHAWDSLSEVRSAASGTGWASSSETTEDTSGSHPGVTTDDNDQLVIGLVATAKPDTNDSGLMTSVVNSSGNLVNAAPMASTANTSMFGTFGDLGGGLGAWSAGSPKHGEDPFGVGSIGTTTWTWEFASAKAALLITVRAGGHDDTPNIRACTFGYFITGGAAALKLNSPNTSGAYGVAGTDATLTGPAGSETLVADSGAYSLTGTAADLDVKMPVDSGVYGLTGTDATLTFDAGAAVLTALSGAYEYTGAAGASEADLVIGGGSAETRNWLLQRQTNPHWRFLRSYRQKYKRGGGVGGIH